MNQKCNIERQVTYWGVKNQTIIEQAKIAIIGVGGLGSIAAELLCRMNIGTLILCDFDTVAEHNLSRQHLYNRLDIGTPKVLAAKKHLEKINPTCKIELIQEKASANNMNWCKSVNIILDCTDRHESRREIDCFCKEEQIPWIHGAAIEEQGTVFAFLPERKIYYDDIYQQKTTNTTCKERGVLATITTIVGAWQVSFAIQQLLSRPVPDTLLRIRADSGEVEHIKIAHKAL